MNIYKLQSLGAGLLAATSALGRRVTLSLLFLGAGLVLVQPCSGGSGTFTNTGSLVSSREFHTATLLPNGKVLAAGGFGTSGLPASGELYDPASGIWSATGSLVTPRYLHTATLLPNGKVLVAGGDGAGGHLTSAELYDPASGTWTATGSLATARRLHTATLLPNGKVLVTGGNNGTVIFASAELYDPASGIWTVTGSLATARNTHTATLLPNGKVLVAGGSGTSGVILASAELYDPASGTWTATGSLASAHDQHTATLLPNGKVLVASGRTNNATAELYDSASGTWTVTGSLAAVRNQHTATLLPNGMVLVAGGNGTGVILASAELYDPASGSWALTGSLATERRDDTATLLPNGQVLVAGGISTNNTYLASAELYGAGQEATPFINGSFESPGAPDYVVLQDSSTFVTGWVVGTASSSVVYEAAPNQHGLVAQAGRFAVSFGHNGSTTDTLSQTFSTVPGSVYLIQYFVSRIQGGDVANPQSLVAEAFDAGTSNKLAEVSTTIPSDINHWVSGSALTFTATSTSTRLRFRDTTAVGGDDNWALDHVTVNGDDGSGEPIPPPHGGLSATILKVNESSSSSANVADTVLRFSAQQSGHPAGLKVRVQYSTDPNTESSWKELPNGTGGHMTCDASGTNFVLNTTGYPLLPNVSFRAISEAHGYPDSVSNKIGTFDLASNKTHLGPTVLTLSAGGIVADLVFDATESTSGVSMRVQSTTTPANEGSWTDLSNGNSGAMQPTNDPTLFRLLVNQLPPTTDKPIYFRAVASLNGAVDSLSAAIGPRTITADVPPIVTVTVTPPYALFGSGDGHDLDHPILIAAGTFNFGATVQSARQIDVLQLHVDGDTVRSFGKGAGSGATDYGTNVLGDHVLEAVAIDDLGARCRAGTGAIFIRVIPSGAAAAKSGVDGRTAGANVAAASTGKVFKVANSGGNWDDSATWVDLGGAHGTPGPDDFAVIDNNLSVQLSPLPTVGAVSINGGHLIGPGFLTVIHTFTMTAGSFDNNVVLSIGSSATCNLFNGDILHLNGEIINFGTLNLHGAGELDKIVKVTNTGGITFQYPLTIPKNAALDPTAGLQILRSDVVADSGKINSRPAIITHDGGSIIGHDGASIITHDGASIITHDGASVTKGGGVISTNGSNIVSQGGGNIVSQGGGNIIGHDGASIITHDGGSRVGSANQHAASTDSGFTQTGGETDLSSVSIVGPVTLSGGVLSGSGVILGDLTNDGGFIAPGHSAGRMEVSGNFVQGANGTLVLENGGASPSQFDQLQLGGSATLGGKLDIKTINGYTPDAADTFSPLGASSVSGSFSSVSSNAQVTVTGTGLLTSVDPTKPNPTTGQPLNIATRLQVQGGDNVLVAGFIITGPAGSTKKVLIRGIGPSLANFGVAGTIPDPLLELHKADGTVVTNDNWQQDANAGQIPAGFAPSSSLESAIYTDLGPGNYTAILKGAHNETGVALAEVYDFETTSAVKLANIATRGFVNTGDNVMIGGFIIGGTEPANVLVRAIGPSLIPFGVQGALPATTLELHDSNGSVISNEGWRNTQEAEITATTIPPSNDNEAAILATLVPGNYTAVVRGKNDTIGIAVVEAYNLP